MPKKFLIDTNPHLKDAEKYRQALITNVSTSTAIETGLPVEEVARSLIQVRKNNRVKQPKDSAR